MKTLQDWEKEKQEILTIFNEVAAKITTETKQLYKQVVTRQEIIRLIDILDTLKSVKVKLAGFDEMTEVNVVNEKKELFHKYQASLIPLQIALGEKFLIYKYKLLGFDNLYDQKKRYSSSSNKSDVELLKKASLNLIEAWEAMNEGNYLKVDDLRSYSKKCASLQLELGLLSNVMFNDIPLLKDSANKSELQKVRCQVDPQLWTKQLEEILTKLNNAEASFYFRWQETVMRFRQYFNQFILKQKRSDKTMQEYMINTFCPEFSQLVGQYTRLIAATKENESLKPRLVNISADVNAFFHSILTIYFDATKWKKSPAKSLQQLGNFTGKLAQLMETITAINSHFAVQAIMLQAYSKTTIQQGQLKQQKEAKQQQQKNLQQQAYNETFEKRLSEFANEEVTQRKPSFVKACDEDMSDDDIEDVLETFNNQYIDMRDGIEPNDDLSKTQEIQNNEEQLDLATLKENLMLALKENNTAAIPKYFLLIGDYSLKMAYKEHDIDFKITHFTEAKKYYRTAINKVVDRHSSLHDAINMAIDKVEEELNTLLGRKQNELAKLNKGRDEAKERLGPLWFIPKENISLRAKKRQDTEYVVEQLIELVDADYVDDEAEIVYLDNGEERDDSVLVEESSNKQASHSNSSETEAGVIIPTTTRWMISTRQPANKEIDVKKAEKQSKPVESPQSSTPSYAQIAAKANHPAIIPSVISEKHQATTNKTEEKKNKKQSERQAASPQLSTPSYAQIAAKANYPVNSPSVIAEKRQESDNKTEEEKSKKQSEHQATSPQSSTYTKIATRANYPDITLLLTPVKSQEANSKTTEEQAIEKPTKQPVAVTQPSTSSDAQAVVKADHSIITPPTSEKAQEIIPKKIEAKIEKQTEAKSSYAKIAARAVVVKVEKKADTSQQSAVAPQTYEDKTTKLQPVVKKTGLVSRFYQPPKSTTSPKTPSWYEMTLSDSDSETSDWYDMALSKLKSEM